MGKGQSKISKNKDITNTQVFKNIVKKSVTSLNKMNTTLIQKQCTEVSSQNIINQKISITGVKTKDFEIDELDLKADTKFNMSVLANSKMRNDMVNKVTQQIKDQIQHMATSTEKQARTEGEPVFADAIGGITDALDTAMGDLTRSKHELDANTTVANTVNLDNETDLKEKIENSVDTKLVNNIVNKLKNSLLVNQGVDISNIEASDKFHIAKININFLTSVVQDTVSKSDLSSKIVSSFAGTSVSTVKTAADASQDQKTDEKTAIDDAGDAVAKDVKAVGDASAENINAVGDAGAKMELAFLMPIVIGGVIFLIIVIIIFVSMGKKSGSIKKIAKMTPQGKLLNKFADKANSIKNTAERLEQVPKTFQTGEGPEDDFNSNNNYFNSNKSSYEYIIFSIMIVLLILCFAYYIVKNVFYFPIKFPDFNSKKDFVDQSKSYFAKLSLYNKNTKLLYSSNIFKTDRYLGKYDWPLYITDCLQRSQQVHYCIDSSLNKMFVYKYSNGGVYFLTYSTMFNRFFFEEYNENNLKNYHLHFEQINKGYLLSHNDIYMTLCDQRSIIGIKPEYNNNQIIFIEFIPIK